MNNLITSLKNLIIEAGKIALIRRNLGLIISYKKDHSPVTNADKDISDFIYNGLNSLTPNISVICEERDLGILPQDSFWLVDPIDGTQSYIKGEETYTVNIALIQDCTPTIGFIYQPSKCRLCYTDENNTLKIEQNGIEIKLSTLKQKGYSATISSRALNLETKNFLNKHNITRVVSVPSSIKLCLVAEGVVDIYPKFGTTMEWDIAAGHALIKASGGNVIGLDGNELIYKKKNYQNSNFYACSRCWLEEHKHNSFVS